MLDVVIVEAMRSLGALLEPAGVDSSVVGQVTGGCVSQIGQQSRNITRDAWLAAGIDRRRRRFWWRIRYDDRRPTIPRDR